MTLTPKQIEHIERIKEALGIDKRIGDRLSDLARKKGSNAGIQPITPAEGQDVSKSTFNKTIILIADHIP